MDTTNNGCGCGQTSWTTGYISFDPTSDQTLFKSAAKPVLLEVLLEAGVKPVLIFRTDYSAARIETVDELNMFLADLEGAVAAFAELLDLEEASPDSQADGFAD